MILPATTSVVPVAHYLWAGLDFMIDADGCPVLLEANRSSHMLGEYMEFHGDERPFEFVVQRMNAAPGPPCLLWRRDDPLPDAEEDATYIGRYLTKYLREPPQIANVEDNQHDRDWLLTRTGQQIHPGSLFRWWYGLPWSYERSGTLLINSNALWVTVRDKGQCYNTLSDARHFRVPRSFTVDSAAEATQLLLHHPDLFPRGYVIKPRVGWGGYGVRISENASPPDEVAPGSLLCERIWPSLRDGCFWDVRVFVMTGEYLGGVLYRSRSPVTNYFQGGEPCRLDKSTEEALRLAALEAVLLLDQAAARVHALPPPLDNPLTHVTY